MHLPYILFLGTGGTVDSLYRFFLQKNLQFHHERISSLEIVSQKKYHTIVICESDTVKALEKAREVKKTLTVGKIVVVGTEPVHLIHMTMFQALVWSVLSSDEDPHQILRTVITQCRMFDETLCNLPLKGVGSRFRFTRGQKELLWKLCLECKTISQIAQETGRSVKTVQANLTNLYGKINFGEPASRALLCRWYYAHAHLID
jgi:DNA-binding NarL/FixJ family response regulator